VSHWTVDSEATVSIITKAFGAMRADPRVGPAEALRRSILAMIAGRGNTAQSALSAPFVVGAKARNRRPQCRLLAHIHRLTGLPARPQLGVKLPLRQKTPRLSAC